jgi:hypothetical protein
VTPVTVIPEKTVAPLSTFNVGGLNVTCRCAELCCLRLFLFKF